MAKLCLRGAVSWIASWAAFLAVLAVAGCRGCLRRELLWGPTPLINNKHWSSALREGGLASKTLMTHHYPANSRSDFDLYYEDLVRGLPGWLVRIARLDALRAFAYVLRNASVAHISFNGGPLGSTPFWRWEAQLYRLAGIKTVVIPYGSDAHLYSEIQNTSLRMGLLVNYPAAGRNESAIRERVAYWTRHADCIVCGSLIYGMGRWDVTTVSPLCVDVARVPARTAYTDADGSNAPVRVVHAPNHRGHKGTEFLLHAVEELRREGLRIELVLLENVPNQQVMEELARADILVEQLIAGVYALNAIEGMAHGAAVVTNLEDLPRTQLFRRYAYLDECPVASATPENVAQVLKKLVQSPALRRELGLAGRQYAEKYHSYEAARFLFSSIYAALLDGKEVDLINLFHPLKSEFNRRSPPVSHPLRQSRLAP